MGDIGDNVFGVEDVGPKRAISLVNQYGSAYDVAAALPINSKYKYIQNLNKFGKDNILLNYRLMDLVTYCEEALGETNCAIIKQEMENYVDNSNARRLASYA
jgi:5'-3' exonuclease